MKKAIAIVALLTATTGLAVARIPSETTHATIVGVMQARMHVPVIIVGPMSQEGVWIVTRWDTGDPGGKGEAVTKQKDSTWIVVRSATGTRSMENVAYLESIGVPAATAEALVKDMKKL